MKRHVIQDVVLLKLVGFKPIIVHGGGKEISRWVSKVGKEPKFVNGLRVTDEETMEIAEMVLNKVNKSLVSLVHELGVKAVGISGKDGELLRVDRKYSNGQDIGYVGEVKEVNPKILYDLLEKDFLPAHFSIAADDTWPTCRLLDRPYDGSSGKSLAYVLDGFLVSDNLKISRVSVINTDFAYTDHQPVILEVQFLDKNPYCPQSL